jgi:Ohr subfamily peroxiredoxin
MSEARRSRAAITAAAARVALPRAVAYGGPMPSDRIIYTAEAHVTGGRVDGHGRTSDGALDVQLRTPPELGGDGGGTNPEQLFAVGYAACFESALGTAGRRRRQEVGDVAIDARVMLQPASDRRWQLAVALDVALPSVADADEAVALVRDAHAICPYSNATRGNIDVAITANGHALEEQPAPIG